MPRSRGIEVSTLTAPFSELDRAVLDGEAEGFARVHLTKRTDQIPCATMVPRHAGEMINEFSLAISSGLGILAIGKTVHPSPAQGEAIKKLADAYNRRLTPLVNKMLAAWLSWQRD